MKQDLRLPPPRLTLFGLLTISAAVTTVWFGFEEYLLSTKQRPITWYTRRLVNKYWMVGRTVEAIAMFTIGVSFAHFVLDSDKQPPGR